MKFDLWLTTQLKLLWLPGFLLGIGAFSAVIFTFLGIYNSFLAAGVGAALFFGGGWLFFRIEKRISEPIRLIIGATEIIELHRLTGVRRVWLFDDILTYKFSPPFRSHATLRFTLRTGDKIKLMAYDAGFTNSSNTSSLVAVTTAFGEAWRRHNYGQSHS